MKESAVANHIRLAAAQNGIELWRNNNGAFQDETGRWIRYGLCNDSAQLAKNIKSSDFVGMAPVLITPDMVGQVLGVFVAVETKPSDWVFRESDKRAVAQSKFHDIVKRAGGFAGFARSVEEFLRIIKR